MDISSVRDTFVGINTNNSINTAINSTNTQLVENKVYSPSVNNQNPQYSNLNSTKSNSNISKNLYGITSPSDQKAIRHFGETLAIKLKAGNFNPHILALSAPNVIKSLAAKNGVILETQLTKLQENYKANPFKNSNYISPRLLLQPNGIANSLNLLI